MLQLQPTQLAHARGIVAACKSRGLPVRAAHIALATALTESALWMYANGNNPRSLQLPHDRVGWDHGSVGLFQQQVGGAPNSTANWGTTDELMSPVISCGKFLNALGPVAKWQGLTNWAACQSVQVSAFPDGSNYRAHDADAIDLGNSLWASVTPQSPPQPSGPAEPIASVTYVVRPGDTLATIAAKARLSIARLIAQNVRRYPSLASNPNMIDVGWVLYLRGSAASGTPVPPQRSYVVQAGDSLTVIARHYPHLTWQAIARANGIDNPNVIHAGQRLVIP
jgi:LysM repeat protein